MARSASAPVHARFDAVAFDLDGTLVDSAADIGHALNSALTKAGLQRFDLHTVKSWIGDGPDALIQRALAAQGLGAPSGDALHCRLRRAFDVSTLAAPLNYGRVYDGVPELLSLLAERVPLVVITNKPTPLARAVLASAQLLGYMKFVQGADTAAMRKPAPTMLLSIASRLDVEIERVLMVGDSAVDLHAATAAGCAAAWAGWGYSTAADVGIGSDHDGPPWHAATPTDLWPLLQLHAVTLD